MNLRIATAFALAFSFVGLAGCKKESPASNVVPKSTSWKEPAAEPIAFPELGTSRVIQPGVKVQEATLQRGKTPMRVWFYQPEKAAEKLPLVLVPPAGSALFFGMAMADGDRAEHYPYVKAGFAVASFDIDGHVAQRTSDAALSKGAREFQDASAGLANARATIDFLLAKAPNIDPNRIYIAGHSSAGTLALLVAEHEPRIKACAAYAPCTDVEARLGSVISSLDSAHPGFRDFLRFSSPKTNTDTLKCPVFLFHAQDDDNVSVRETTAFATQLKKTNSKVTFVTTPKGGHYESMIEEGVPKAIAWLKELPKEKK